MWQINQTYPHGFIGLKTVHVVGSPKTPWGKELEQVDFDWCLHKNDVIGGQTKTEKQMGLWMEGLSLNAQRNEYTQVVLSYMNQQCLHEINYV